MITDGARAMVQEQEKQLLRQEGAAPLPEGMSFEEKSRELCVRACETFLRIVHRQEPSLFAEEDAATLSEEELKQKRQERRGELVAAVARLWVLNELGLEFYFAPAELDALVLAAIQNQPRHLEKLSSYQRLAALYELLQASSHKLLGEGEFALRVRLAALRLHQGEE